MRSPNAAACRCARDARPHGANLRRALRRSDGRIRATFEIVWLSGWAPHESQQKPLRPGSAKTRLADALGCARDRTGEKPR